MANIQDLLADILSARYGEEVRGSIHDAIEQCYQDGQMAATDLVARNDIAQILNNIGALANLDTTDKSNLVNAINEVLNASGGGNTYTLSKSGSTITLSGSDGSTSSVTDDDGGDKVAINLIPYPYYSKSGITSNGITFTVNEDMSITANGTATATATFVVIGRTASVDYRLENGKKYILSGCPKGGDLGIFLMSMSYTKSDGTSSVLGRDYGDGMSFDYIESTHNYVGISISIARGYTANNLVFKPMLEEGTVAHSFVPYIGKNTFSEAIGNLDSLETTNKNNIVEAINEVATSGGGGGGTGAPVLLWTNPNPTSNFGEQNIALDLSKYTKVLVRFKSSTSNVESFDTRGTSTSFYYYDDECYVGGNSMSMFPQFALICRPFKVNQNGIAFNNASQYRVNDGAFTTTINTTNYNMYGIPYEIYGIA